MITPRPGSRASRVAALMLLAIVLTFVWLVLLAPWRSARDALDEELASAHRLRGRFFSAAGAGTPVRQADPLIAAPTAEIAAATLQSLVEAEIEEAGGTAERLEARVLPRRDGTARLEPVQVDATFSGTVAQLRAFLLGLEAGPTALIVDELTVRAGVASGEAEAASPATLSVQVVVRGFRPRDRGRR